MAPEQAAGADVPGEEEGPEAAATAWAGRGGRRRELLADTGRAAMAESMVGGVEKQWQTTTRLELKDLLKRWLAQGLVVLF